MRRGWLLNKNQREVFEHFKAGNLPSHGQGAATRVNRLLAGIDRVSIHDHNLVRRNCRPFGR
jgi:hypothetical protein